MNCNVIDVTEKNKKIKNYYAYILKYIMFALLLLNT